jgi:hypothetical protein
MSLKLKYENYSFMNFPDFCFPFFKILTMKILFESELISMDIAILISLKITLSPIELIIKTEYFFESEVL